MDYKKKYFEYKKKYLKLKNKIQIGGIPESYIDEQWESSFTSSIIKEYNIAINALHSMKVNEYIRIDEKIFSQLKFHMYYSTSLGKPVYKSKLICDSGYYFEVEHKSFIITKDSNPIRPKQYFAGVKLLLKQDVCYNTYSFYDIPSILSTDYYEDFNKYYQEDRLHRKERELDDYEEELSEREEKLKQSQKKSKKRKKRKSKRKKKRKSKKRKSKKRKSKKKKSKK